MRLYSNIKYLFSLREIKREAHLLLGGNLGDVQRTFEKAEEFLLGSFTILGKSSLYQSEPWGMVSENLFLNQVWKVETVFSPQLLLEKLLAAELQFGRERLSSMVEGSYFDRTLDIDILFMGDLVLNSDKLVLPHPRLHLRAFTLQALVEVAPDFIHPVLLKSTSYLLENCTDHVKARKLD